METSDLALLIALVAAAVALILALFAFLAAKKAQRCCDKHEIKGLMLDEIRSYMSFEGEQKILRVLRNEMAREELKAEVFKAATSALNEPENPVGEAVETPSETSQVQETTTEDVPIENALPEPVVLYTGICKDGAFKHVTTVPDNKTVFIICAESKDAVEGILKVDESAYDKIAQTPDYLQNACVYSGNGTQLKVTKTGTVIKENGTWVVKEPIVAEFN